jgi:hypothetical protein
VKLTDFYSLLRKLRSSKYGFKPYLSYPDNIRLVTISCQDTCPITAVLLATTDKLVDVCLPRIAGDALGLTRKQSEAIIAASDDYDEHSKNIRRQLMKILFPKRRVKQ